jgi:hypothetical protein
MDEARTSTASVRTVQGMETLFFRVDDGVSSDLPR